MDRFNYFRKIEADQITNKGNFDPWLAEAKNTEYPINGNSCVCDGHKFMRIAVCNRKVVETNGRPVHHIDKISTPFRLTQKVVSKDKQAIKKTKTLFQKEDNISDATKW